MKWLDKLERKYGKYAIPNLMYYVIILYILGFVIDLAAPGFYQSYLALDASAILYGQIWRVVTFIIQPPNSSYFFMAFALYLYYMIGKTLEYMWGAFRFNLYFFSGMLMHVAACLLIYLLFDYSFQFGSFYLNMSLFFVYVSLFPDAEFMLFFLIPIKAKWLGIIEGLYFGITIAAGFFVPIGSGLWYQLLKIGVVAFPANSIAALLSLLNFILFFLGSRRSTFSPKQAKHRREYRKVVKKTSGDSSHHRCAVCGRTEKDGEDLEFRYCSKCIGNYEYCQDHLFTHEHRK